MEVEIPGYRALRLNHVVMDYNGTLACDGFLIDGVKEALVELSNRFTLHVLTADTFGRARAALADVPCTLSILPKDDQAEGKLKYVQSLGAEQSVCIGNGRNDRMMLEAAGLGIAVILEEGASVETVRSADVVCTTIRSALALLKNPLRLTATLRS